MAESGATIEQEIAQLEKQLQDKKADLDRTPSVDTETKETPSDKEILRDIVGQQIQQNAPSYVPKPAPQSDDDTDAVLPELRDKVQELVNLIFQGSLEQGVKEVVKSNNPALIDAFHDVIVNQLYDALVERKKLEP